MESIKFEKYRLRREIEAVRYEPGMEDGFDIRYCSQQEMDDYKSGKIDSVSTWGIPSLDGTETIEIKVPYVKMFDQKVLLGEGYYLIKDENGNFFGLPEDEFNRKYQRSDVIQNWLNDRKNGWVIAQENAPDLLAREKYHACEEEVKVIINKLKDDRNKENEY